MCFDPCVKNLSDKQESIPLGCVPAACHTCFSSHQMSAPVEKGGLREQI